MARLEGMTRGGSLTARIAFFFCKRQLGRVITPVRIHALHSPLLFGYGQMERAQGKARAVPERLKAIGSIRIAQRIGCPF